MVLTTGLDVVPTLVADEGGLPDVLEVVSVHGTSEVRWANDEADLLVNVLGDLVEAAYEVRLVGDVRAERGPVVAVRQP